MKLHAAGQPWTTERNDALKRDFADGLDLASMCRNHGRTASAIVGQLCRLGLLIPVGNLRAYHRVDPDPWVLASTIQLIDREVKGGHTP